LKKQPWNSSTEKAKTFKIEDFGTPDEVREMAKMPLSADSFSQARRILFSLAEKPMSGKLGLSATVSKKAIKEYKDIKTEKRLYSIEAIDVDL
jgi:hypothetical protein